MVNFFTFKWGDKYGPEYVNRLHGSLLKYVTVPFKFTCITDDVDGIYPEINTIDYDTWDPFDYPKDRIFTREKIVLFDRFTEGNNFWIDLDFLLQGDITELVTRNLATPTFIWNYWNWNKAPAEQMLAHFGSGNMCFVNSSFVGWTGNAGKFIYDYLTSNEEISFYTYKSLDKFLFYQMNRKGLIDFWEDGIFYNYNFEQTKFQYMEGYKGCLFNTSHIQANNIQGVEAYEIHQADGWAKDLWESHDEA